jgi:hypothetical protein
MTEVVIVGNAPLAADRSALVDAAGFVVRFNLPRTWGETSGTRFDAWVLANGRAGRHFARRAPFLDAPYRDLPREIWFPRALDVHRELKSAHAGGFAESLVEDDFSARILKRNRLRQPGLHFGADLYRRCLALLRDEGGLTDPTMIPSAGFLATLHVLERMPESRVALIGFTFEGWPGHPWAQESRHIHRLAEAGRLTLLPG